MVLQKKDTTPKVCLSSTTVIATYLCVLFHHAKNGHYYFISAFLVQVLVFVMRYCTQYSVCMPLKITQEVHQIRESLRFERLSKGQGTVS